MEKLRQSSKIKVNSYSKILFFIFGLALVGAFSFGLGLFWSKNAHATESEKKQPKVIYPKKTNLDFEGLKIEGEIRNPGEFYFQHRNEEKFDSLVQRRKNFHREMLRDVVLGK